MYNFLSKQSDDWPDDYGDDDGGGNDEAIRTNSLTNILKTVHHSNVITIQQVVCTLSIPSTFVR